MYACVYPHTYKCFSQSFSVFSILGSPNPTPGTKKRLNKGLLNKGMNRLMCNKEDTEFSL